MGHLLLIIAAVGTGVFGSRFFPTEEMLQDRFALGQQYYAANDHANSVQIFSEIENTPSYALLDVDRIEVTIGDLTLPIKVAATYQLGNSNRNVGQTLLERSRNAAAEGDSALARRRLAEAEAAFGDGKVHYRQLVAAGTGVPRHLQGMAAYQIVRASYQMGDYEAVVGEAGDLLDKFPASDYREAALYDAGWAHYHMGQYRQAIATYGLLIEDSSDALKFDRALFQTGESYYALGQYAEARVWYGRLVAQYDFASFSEKELQAMKTERLRGLVRETTRELVAKAQIRIADAHAAERDLDAAIAAYSRVPERYPQEDLLVQKSFDNMAEMVFDQQGLEPGVAVLRQAIEQVSDPHFRGRVQLKVARAYYAAGDYPQAIAEYGVYQKAYGEHAASIGVTLDQVDFLIAEAHRLLAAQGGDEQHLQRARSGFERLLRDYPHSARRAEAHYGLGLTLFRFGDPVAAGASFAAAVAEAPRAPVAPHALSWQARMAHTTGEGARALALYKRIVADYPESELVDQAWKDQALVYKDMGALDEAIAALGQVGRTSPLWTKVQAEAGDLLLAAGRLDRLETEFDIAGALATAESAGDGETVAELHYILGRIAREEGDRQGVVSHMGAVIERGSGAQLLAFSHFFRGLARYQLGGLADAAGDSLRGRAHFEAAVADLDRLLTAEPAVQLRAVAYRTRGVALTRLNRSAEAVETYQLLIDSAPNAAERSEFELMLMELYYDQGQLAQTEEVARTLAAGGEVESDIAERAYFVLVSLMLEAERYEEALATASEALERFPASADRATLESVRARSLFFLERYEAAATAFADFIAAYPDHAELPSALFQQGYCHEFLGQYEKAAAAFGALADRFARNPLAGDALYRRAENLYNASKFQQALAAYLRVLADYGDSPLAAKALYSASWTYMDLGQEAESVAAMERLANEYPGSEYARFAQFSIGDYHYSEKAFALAQGAYRRVVDRYPGTEEATKAQGLIVDLDEDLASAAYDEAFALFDRGNFAAAVRGFDRIYQDYPRSYSALAALANKGVALEHLGNGDDARNTYARVLELVADDPELANIAEFVTLRLENL